MRSFTKSLAGKGKKTFKGKEIAASIYFTSYTTIILHEHIERYGEHSSQVPRCLLGYATTIDNLRLENYVRFVVSLICCLLARVE